ncbi:MAG TPA: tyrosinase family protein, partial [Schlesneria sp.]
MADRRTFLQAVAAAAVGIDIAPRRIERFVASRLRAFRVRRNINSLDPNGPEVAILRAGVKAMQALNPLSGLPTNPKSWGYQRAIHKFPSAPNPSPTAWNTCTHHGSPGPGFVSWHRAYLYYFERICRSVSGDDNFTLPYWNYDKPGQNVMPWPFVDNSVTDNPLLYARGNGINAGAFLAPAAVGEELTVSETDFGTFQEALQDCHDATHLAIGGDMGSVWTAALDPIFYLHHANIDRCWRHWQRLHQGTADPSPLPSWWNTQWTFFDENGNQVQMTGQQ